MKLDIRNKLEAINSEFTNEPLKYEKKVLPNLGYLLVDVPSTLMNMLRQERKKLESDFNKGKKYNNRLSGQIEQEYEIIDSRKHLEKFVKLAADEYYKLYNNQSVMNDLQIINVWINFQKKYEYNPTHTHSGILSFVIWLDIPYDIEDEFKEKLSKDSAKPHAGCFSFIYTNAVGGLTNEIIPADKTYNGKMLIFPANLMHCVYPFQTSDEYRVSISGNLK